MDTTVLRASEWAQAEFAGASLGDARRTRRLVRVASALAEKPAGTLPPALPNWAELKAAYRLFAAEEVTYERVIDPHWRRTRRACGQPGEHLLIEDTTQLDFTQRREVRGLGRIGDDGGRGFCLHTTLAARIERWGEDGVPEVRLMGLFGQKCWTRGEKPKRRRESRRQRLERRRESQRWAEVFEQSGPPPAGAKWIYTADRESDIYEAFGRCRERRVDYIVRASQRRALEGEDASVFDAVCQAPCLGSFRLELRARPGRRARTATVEVRALRVRLRGPWRPGGRRSPLSTNVVEAREVRPPVGAEPIRWVLLTSLPIEGFGPVRKIIGAYSQRWLVEEYHKALKTGVRIERSQLPEANRLKALLGVLAVVAVRLLNTKLLARAQPHSAVAPEEIGPEALRILEAKFGRPKGGWSYRPLLVAIARMGGFLARKGDGDPGWITIWRGWKRLIDMAHGYSLATATETR